MPGILRSSHPYYLEALDKTWEWVIKNICSFEPKPHLSFQESLVKWINGYLHWRIKDLYLRGQRQYQNEQSLDIVINESDKNPTTLLEQISETGFSPPTLSGLERYLEEQRKKEIEEIFEIFERYVEEDPKKLLQNCHPHDFPNCNCQLLCKKRLFKEPPESFANISQKLEINYQTLISHWKNRCLPLIRQILSD